MESMFKLETMRTTPQDAATRERARAAEVADQFEAVFVKTLVGTLRQTSSFGGEGGMFGSGPGADTYASWFDQNVADELADGGGIGIARALLDDMVRHGEIQADEAAAAKARRAADHASLDAASKAPKSGGYDVVL